jgi:hypothetical protein
MKEIDLIRHQLRRTEEDYRDFRLTKEHDCGQ